MESALYLANGYLKVCRLHQSKRSKSQRGQPFLQASEEPTAQRG